MDTHQDDEPAGEQLTLQERFAYTPPNQVLASKARGDRRRASGQTVRRQATRGSTASVTRAADSSPPPAPALIDIETLAGRLGDSVRHLRRLVADRRIPFLKIGHLIRFDPVEINEWLEQQRVRPVTKGHSR